MGIRPSEQLQKQHTGQGGHHGARSSGDELCSPWVHWAFRVKLSEDPRTRTRRGRPAENYLISRCDASHGYKENNLKHFILLDTMASLSGQALQASRAALNAALADNKDDVDSPLEPGEIQEVDMQAQAEGLRTVFSDPKNFNVKVWPPRRLRTRGVHNGTAPTLFPVDSLV
jgi:hypothetical protein